AINWTMAEGGWKATELAEGENPATRIRRNAEHHRREWIRPQEIPALLVAIEGERDPWLRGYFRMLLYTGARKGELQSLRWDDVDLNRPALTLRETKNREDHTLPLTPEAVKLLAALPRMEGNPFVFCGH